MRSQPAGLCQSELSPIFRRAAASVVGTAVQTMLEAWLVYRLTHSTTWVSVINLCTQSATFLASPVAGVMTDRYDRRGLLLATELVAMTQPGLLAALFFIGVMRTWQIAILAAICGAANAFEMATRNALAAELVGEADLASAIGMNAVASNVGRAVGPAVAAAFVGMVGEGREGWGSR
jgi:MFS family permease